MKRVPPAAILIVFACWVVAFFCLAITGSTSHLPSAVRPIAATAKIASEGWLTKDAAGFFAFVAVIVATVQAVLVVAQLQLFRQSLEPTRLAAEAAKRSADHIPIVERAYLYVESILCDGLINAPSPDEEGVVNVVVAYKFRNHGRTPAVVRNSEIKIHFALPSEPPKQMHNGKALPYEFVVGSGLAYGPHTANVPLRPEVLERIQAGVTLLYFYGFVGYQDIFGGPHSIGFCAYWDRHGKRFVLPNDGIGNFST